MNRARIPLLAFFAIVSTFVVFSEATAASAGSEEENGTSESADDRSTSEKAPSTSGDSSDGDDNMTEQERQKWKKEKRRARKIAVKYAAAPGGWLERSWTWDFNADIGWRVFGGAEGWTYRVRSGLTRIAEPNAFTLGLTGQLEPGGRPVLGAQLEMLSLHLGTFARLGAGTHLQGGAAWSAGVGWQIFGVEARYRPSAATGSRWRGLAMFRIPVSWIIRGVAPEAP